MGQKISAAVKAYAKNPATLALATAKLGGNPKPAPGAPAKGLIPAKGLSPAAPSPAPLPWDSNYENTIDAINLTKTNSLAGLANEETGVKQQYGFDDLSDPFSRLKQMQLRFSQQKDATTNGMAAAGQLYSGALANQQDADQHNYDVDYDQTRRDYQSALDGIAQRRTAATDQATNDAGTADYNRTMTALANRPDPSTIAPAPAAKEKDYTERPVAGGVWHDYKDGRKPVFVKKG